MNSMEWAVRDGVPYAIDFMNPAPDMDVNSLTPHYFDWVVEHMADMAIRLAQGAAPQLRGAALERELSARAAARAADGAAAGDRRLPRPAERRGRQEIAGAARRPAAPARPVLRRAAAVHRAAAALPDDPRSTRSCSSASALLPRSTAALRAAMADPRSAPSSGCWTGRRRCSSTTRGSATRRPVSRLDAFFTHERGGLRFTEYNAETPAAAAYNDVLAEVTSACPSCGCSCALRGAAAAGAAPGDARAAGRVPQQWSGTRARPRIAILDWREVPTYSEFVITQTTSVAGPRVRDRRPARGRVPRRRLYAGDMQVDLIYKRVLITSWSSAAAWTTRSCGPCATARSAW
jgi:hypothetical protein